MSVIGIEQDIETVLKAALVADTNVANGYSYKTGTAIPKATVFRSWLLDDELTDDMEEQDFPCVAIATEPAESADGVGGVFWDVPVSVSIMTHHSHDPKRTELARLYKYVAGVVQTALAGFTVVGSATLIIEGGDRSIDENIQTMTIDATAKICGTA
jgi:hypothetical protein